MIRTCLKRGPFGWRVTQDDIRDCLSFLQGAAMLVRRGLSGRRYGPCARPRHPAVAFRRRS